MAVLVLGLFGFFSYKFYTKPDLNRLCGNFNKDSCGSGNRCDYKVEYKTGSVGYCRKSILGI